MEWQNTFADFGLQVDLSKQGEQDALCPVCSQSRSSQAHRNEKKVRVNVQKGTWFCHHCGWTGGLSTKRSKDTIVVTEPNPITTNDENSKKVINYMQSRGISQPTLLSCNVGWAYRDIKDRKTGEILKNRFCIAFNYSYKGMLKAVKYRDGNKNFSFDTDKELIFYGIDWVQHFEEIIIVEGEIDRLSFYEAGLWNCVSVPNGATITIGEKETFLKTGKLVIENYQHLKYLDNNYAEFEHVKKVYLATDEDPPGIKLRMELARRLGYNRCHIVRFAKLINPETSKPCKDANEVLKHYGKDELQKLIEGAEPYPIEGVLKITDIWDDIMFQYQQGLIKGKSTGFTKLDPHFKLRLGHTIAVSGRQNMGKTSFLMNIAVNVALFYNWKVGIYSPENYPPSLVYKTLIEIYIGNTFDKDKEMRMTPDQLFRGKDFIKNNIFLVDDGKDSGYTTDELRTVTKQMVQQYGISMFIKDPYNSLNQKRTTGETSWDFLKRDLSDEIRLATRYNIVNIIAVHPITPIRTKDGEVRRPNIYDLEQGVMWGNKMYDVLIINKPEPIVPNTGDETNIQDIYINDAEIYVEKTKFHDLVGLPTLKEKPVVLTYERRTKRFLEDGESPIDRFLRNVTQTELEYEGTEW
jgi:twinkle protein